MDRRKYACQNHGADYFCHPIRGSICTPEKAAGFRNKEDGAFTGIMLIHSYKDVERFKEKYGIDTIKTEY